MTEESLAEIGVINKPSKKSDGSFKAPLRLNPAEFNLYLKHYEKLCEEKEFWDYSKFNSSSENPYLSPSAVAKKFLMDFLYVLEEEDKKA